MYCYSEQSKAPNNQMTQPIRNTRPNQPMICEASETIDDNDRILWANQAYQECVQFGTTKWTDQQEFIRRGNVLLQEVSSCNFKAQHAQSMEEYTFYSNASAQASIESQQCFAESEKAKQQLEYFFKLIMSFRTIVHTQKGIHPIVDASNLLAYNRNLRRRYPHLRALPERDYDSLFRHVFEDRVFGVKSFASSRRIAYRKEPVDDMFDILTAITPDWNVYCEYLAPGQGEKDVDVFLASSIQNIISGVHSEGGNPYNHNPNLFKIILFTGDGNNENGEQGFYQTIIRALHDGWEVELVSFVGSCSAKYRDLAIGRSNFKLRLIDDHEFWCP